jgi:parallel beta-helix repeat protein
MIGALVLVLAAATSAAPCLRPTRAGTQVQGDVRVCPGRYRIADPAERGVIIVAGSGTRLDLTGVVLESGDSVAGRFVGMGIASRNVDGVSILGGTIRGYRVGIRLEGGRGHRVVGVALSGSRALPSTEPVDSVNRLDPVHLEVFQAYGSGLMLARTTAAAVTGVTARGGQNGISLLEARESYLADNDVSGNGGWGIQLWRASRNVIVRNLVDHTVRCAPPAADCAAAAILIREGSDSNTVGDNDLTASSTGLRLGAGHAGERPSRSNLIYRNTASEAAGAGFFIGSAWNALLLDNRADSSAFGFQLQNAAGCTIRGNTVIGARTAAIAGEHSADIRIESNVLLEAPVGVLVSAPRPGGPPSRGYRIDDNVITRIAQGIVLQATTGSRLRGNVLDGVGDGIVVDGTGHGTEVTGNVFLRTSGWFIDAPDLAAGGNYWATADASAAAARVRGRISVLPWRPASVAGY